MHRIASPVVFGILLPLRSKGTRRRRRIILLQLIVLSAISYLPRRTGVHLRLPPLFLGDSFLFLLCSPCGRSNRRIVIPILARLTHVRPRIGPDEVDRSGILANNTALFPVPVLARGSATLALLVNVLL
jgi:hypothetical protein